MRPLKLFYSFVLILMISSCGGDTSSSSCADKIYRSDITEQECKDSRVKQKMYGYGCDEYKWTKNQKGNLGLCELSNCCP